VITFQRGQHLMLHRQQSVW